MTDDEGVSEESESMREIYRHDLDRHLWTPPENDESEPVKRSVGGRWRHWLDQLRSFLGMKGE